MIFDYFFEIPIFFYLIKIYCSNSEVNIYLFFDLITIFILFSYRWVRLDFIAKLTNENCIVLHAILFNYLTLYE